MKPKTDEEILKIKHAREAQGYEYTVSDEEWIANYRYRHASLKILASRTLHKFWDWVLVHPKSAIAYGCLFTFFFLFIVGIVPLIAMGAKILNGEVANPLTFDQVSGILVMLLGVVLLIFVWMLTVNFSFDPLVADDEAAYKRKLRRKQLAENNSKNAKGEL